jgi:hypothetical protein
MSLDQAIQGVIEGKADGIGYCLLHSGVGAIDLDKCYNEDTKAIAPLSCCAALPRLLSSLS